MLTYEELTKQGYREGDIIPFEKEKYTIRPGGEVEKVLGNEPFLKQPSSELGVMTSDIADGYVQQGNQTLDKLSGVDTNYYLKSGETTEQYNQRIEQYRASKTPVAAETKPVETKTGKIKFLNLNGQTQEKDQNITPEEYQNLINQGFYVIESSGSIPSWITTGDVQSGKMQAELNQARQEKDQLIANMSKYMVSDAQLNSQIQGINSMYDSRIADMERINRQREGAIKTLGVRIGSRYTGGTGGVFGGIITEEEREGVSRITELQNQKMQAVNAAKSAANTQNWQVYGKQLDLAQKKYEEQTEAVKDYNKLLKENNKKILEYQKTKLEIDKLKMDIGVKKAETLAPFILNFLTGDSTTDAKLIKTIADVQGYEYDYLLGAISKAQGEREKTTSTSDILNWQEAKRGGYTGTFEKWQTDEANRRAKAAGIEDLDKSLTPTEAQTLGLPYGTTRRQAMAKGITPEKPATEAQKTLATYAARIEQANPTLEKLESEIVSMNPISFEPQVWLDKPWLQSDIIQQYMQSSRNFINSVLRRESGAVISPSEFSEARKQYLPQPGDSKEVLSDKRKNRQIIYESFKKGAGSAYSPLEELLPQEYNLNGVIYIKGADGNYYPK